MFGDGLRDHSVRGEYASFAGHIGIGAAGRGICMWVNFFIGKNLYWFGPFMAVGELMGCVQGRELSARALYLPWFILLASFSDTLLVVSILDIVYDCHL